MNRPRSEVEEPSNGLPFKKMKLDDSDVVEDYDINLSLLDFDGDKRCAKTLTKHNIYLCLSCGIYLNGRGKTTPAWMHAVESSHSLFIRVENGDVYSLPSSKLIYSSRRSTSTPLSSKTKELLHKIQQNLNPTFTSDMIQEIIQKPVSAYKQSTSLSLSIKSEPSTTEPQSLNTTFKIPGYLGIQNTRKNSGILVLLTLFSVMPELRDWFLSSTFQSGLSKEEYMESPQNLMQHYKKYVLTCSMAMFVRQKWHPQRIRHHISPHLVIEAFHNRTSHQLEKPHIDPDPVQVFKLFIHHLVAESKSKQLRKLFQGSLTMWSDVREVKTESIIKEAVTKKIPFLMLTLDLPLLMQFHKRTEESQLDDRFANSRVASLLSQYDTSIYNDEKLSSIAQVPLAQLLEKYNGQLMESKPLASGDIRRATYCIRKFPRYLCLTIARFQTDFQQRIEKNRTIVTFPVDDLPSVDGLKAPPYQLFAVICHENRAKDGQRGGPYNPEEAHYTLYIRRGDSFLFMDDNHVTFVEDPLEISISEAYMLIYRKKE